MKTTHHYNIKTIHELIMNLFVTRNLQSMKFIILF
jgi:hypothetical protein